MSSLISERLLKYASFFDGAVNGNALVASAKSKKPKVKKFKDGIVICGEFGSQEVGKILAKYEKKLNLIVCDPPYGVLTKAQAHWDQGITADDYINWTRECLKYLSKRASLYMWGGIGKPHNRIFFEWLSKVEDETGMTMRNLICWEKRRGFGKKDDFLFVREECAWLINGEKPKIFHIPLLDIVRPYAGFNSKYPAKSKFYRRTNIWSVPELFSGKVHIAQKPEKLAEIMIETHTNKGDVVMDPFAGSGSTGLAARKLGRKFILVEMDPKNYRLICDRLSSPTSVNKKANTEEGWIWQLKSIKYY